MTHTDALLFEVNSHSDPHLTSFFFLEKNPQTWYNVADFIVSEMKCLCVQTAGSRCVDIILLESYLFCHGADNGQGKKDMTARRKLKKYIHWDIIKLFSAHPEG